MTLDPGTWKHHFCFIYFAKVHCLLSSFRHILGMFCHNKCLYKCIDIHFPIRLLNYEIPKSNWNNRLQFHTHRDNFIHSSQKSLPSALHSQYQSYILFPDKIIWSYKTDTNILSLINNWKKRSDTHKSLCRSISIYSVNCVFKWHFKGELSMVGILCHLKLVVVKDYKSRRMLSKNYNIQITCQWRLDRQTNAV